MPEQPGEFLTRAFSHSFVQQFLYLEHRGVIHQTRIEHAPDATLTRFFPALHPIADINRAVQTKVDIGAQKAANEFAFVKLFEARPLRPQGERIDEAIWSPAKIAEKEVTVVTRRQASARIIGHASGTSGDVRDGRRIKR